MSYQIKKKSKLQARMWDFSRKNFSSIHHIVGIVQQDDRKLLYILLEKIFSEGSEMWNKGITSRFHASLVTPASQPYRLQTAHCAAHRILSYIRVNPNTKHPLPLPFFSYSFWDIFMERQQEIDLSPGLEIKQVNTARPFQELAVQGLNWLPARLTQYLLSKVCSEVPWGWLSWILVVILWCGWVTGSWKDQVKHSESDGFTRVPEVRTPQRKAHFFLSFFFFAVF